MPDEQPNYCFQRYKELVQLLGNAYTMGVRTTSVRESEAAWKAAKVIENTLEEHLRFCGPELDRVWLGSKKLAST